MAPNSPLDEALHGGFRERGEWGQKVLKGAGSKGPPMQSLLDSVLTGLQDYDITKQGKSAR